MQMLLNTLYYKITYNKIIVFMRAILAGLYIGFGAAMMLLVKTDSSLSPSISAILSGLVFSIGLYLVLITKAELFTGDNLMVLLHKTYKTPWSDIALHLVIVYLGNLIGSMIIAMMLTLLNFDGAAISVSEFKCNLPIADMIIKGILCNILVCLAVWINSQSSGIIGTFFASFIPVMCFVALGFEHSVANMSILPLGFGLGADINFIQIAINLIFVTIGNLIGGAIILPFCMTVSKY